MYLNREATKDSKIYFNLLFRGKNYVYTINTIDIIFLQRYTPL